VPRKLKGRNPTIASAAVATDNEDASELRLQQSRPTTKMHRNSLLKIMYLIITHFYLLHYNLRKEIK
jgi:hypothetical protein